MVRVVKGNGSSGSSRSLSFSEIQTAMTCQARWDFAYGGRLAGSALKRKMMAPILSDGRAWGAAVAAWHSFHENEATLFAGTTPTLARWSAHEALHASFSASDAEMREQGVFIDPGSQLEREVRLAEMLDHYMQTSKQLPNLARLEGEINVALPSRTGRRSSTKYRFGGFLDGVTDDAGLWLVEYKLRANLTPVELIQKQRQIRWYAWSHQRETGDPIVGVIVDERLNEVPKPARIVKGRKQGTFTVSHAKDQMTTADLYVEACREYDVDPDVETEGALLARTWQQRVPIQFRPGELAEAGRELVSAAKLIRDLDSGDLFPVRNAQRALCQSCQFKSICVHPRDRIYVETLYERVPAKRDR